MDALQGVKEGHEQVHQHSQVEGDAAPEWHVPGAPVQDGLSCKTVDCNQLAQVMLRNALQQTLIMQHIQNIWSINSLQQDILQLPSSTQWKISVSHQGAQMLFCYSHCK